MPDLKKLALDPAYFVDKALVVVVLFGIWTFVNDHGGRWIEAQEAIVAELAAEGKREEIQFAEAIELRKAHTAQLAEFLELMKRQEVAK
jgi:hypothetical protein